MAKKSAQRHTYGYDLVGSPGEKVCLDFVGPLKPTKKGHTSLLTVVDVYTRWFTAWPVKNQKAETVIKLLVREYFPTRGVPSVVHSDNGPAFIAHVFQVAMAAFDVRTTTTPVYNPKSNTVERFHRSMKRKLTALIHEFDDEWDEALPATLLAMRTSVNRTTGFTPFYLEHGREARLPVDMIAGPPPVQSDNLDRYTDKIRQQFAKAFSIVAERQNSYILRQKELYRERQHKINIDDLVWLYTDRANPNLNRKFQSFWSGPYRVVKQLSNTIFEIESYGRWSKSKIITSAAVDRLKKCYITDPETNLGVPVELTATDVRPYFEDQELLGRLPASDFAPHVFDQEQELPMALPADSPRDDLPVAPERQEFPETSGVTPSDIPETAKTIIHDPTLDSVPEEIVTKSEPIEVPEPTRSRGRGRPPGRKNKPKVCPNCVDNVPCVDHCPNCKTGSACEQHTARQRCAKCTRTRSCPAHSIIGYKIAFFWQLSSVLPTFFLRMNVRIGLCLLIISNIFADKIDPRPYYIPADFYNKWVVVRRTSEGQLYFSPDIHSRRIFAWKPYNGSIPPTFFYNEDPEILQDRIPSTTSGNPQGTFPEDTLGNHESTFQKVEETISSTSRSGLNPVDAPRTAALELPSSDQNQESASPRSLGMNVLHHSMKLAKLMDIMSKERSTPNLEPPAPRNITLNDTLPSPDIIVNAEEIADLTKESTQSYAVRREKLRIKRQISPDVATELDLNDAQMSNMQAQVDRRFLVGYDCANPQEVKPISSFVQDPCEPSPNTEPETFKASETGQYQIVQYETRREIKGTRCEKHVSQFTYYCGTADHASPYPQETFYRRPKILRWNECKELASIGQYVAGDGRMYEIPINTRTEIPYFAFGSASAYVGIEGNQITCTGGTIKSGWKGYPPYGHVHHRRNSLPRRETHRSRRRRWGYRAL